VGTYNDQTKIEILNSSRKNHGQISRLGHHLDFDIFCPAPAEVRRQPFELTPGIVSGRLNCIGF